MLLLKILGFLLKAVGILLVTVLGLLLLLFLILLFVPVWYRAKITKQDEALVVKAQVSWLASVVRVPVTYQDGKFDFRAKLLCFTLFPRKKKTTEEVAEAVAEGVEKAVDVAEEVIDRVPENDADKPQLAEGKPQEAEPAVLEKSPGQKQTEQIVQSEGQRQESGGEITDPEAEAAEPEEEPDGPIGRLFYKIRRFFAKIRALYQKVTGWLTGTKERLCGKVAQIKEKVCKLKSRVSEILEFLRAEDTRFALKLAGKSILQLIKYILPYKIKGEVVFGTGDPYSMGQALSVLGIFYGIYARTLKIEADFEATEFRLDGQVEFKGRIRLARILYILLRLWFKGKLKQVIANAKGLIPG